MTKRSFVKFQINSNCLTMARHLEKVFLKKIALQFKLLREKNNLKQEEVYLDTGIHIARIETAKRDLSVSTLKKLCDYFNISVEEFFKGLNN